MTAGMQFAGGAPVEVWERVLARWRDRLRAVDVRTLARLRRAQVWLLWGALALVAVLLVVRPDYRRSLAVYVACVWTLLLWFVVSRTRTLSWSGFARMFAFGVCWSWVIAWVSFRLASSAELGVLSAGAGTAIAGMTEESLKLVPIAAVALIAPGRVRRFAAVDWLLLGLASGMGFQAWEDVVRRLAGVVSPGLGDVLGHGPGSGFPQYGWGLLSGGFGTWSGDEVWGYPGHHVMSALVTGSVGLGVALWRSRSPVGRVVGLLLPVSAWLMVMADHLGYNASLRDRDWTSGDGEGTTAPWAVRTWWDVSGQGTGRGWLLLVVLFAALLVDGHRLHRVGAVIDLPGDGWWARPRLVADRFAGAVGAVVALGVYVARDVMVTVLAHAREPGEGRRAALERGRATAVRLRHVRISAMRPVDGDPGAERRGRALVRVVACVALAVLCVVGLVGAVVVAQRIGTDLTPRLPGWLAGQLDDLGGWWDDRSTGEKILIGAGIAAVVIASGGSLGLGLGITGGAMYVAEHGQGAATFTRDPLAATRSWWNTTTPTGAALDVAEFGLTFVPAGALGAATGIQVRGFGRSAANEIALHRVYREPWQGEGLQLSAYEYGIVRSNADFAREAEKSITPRLQAMVDDLPEGRLVGLEHARKDTDSLARKIATDMQNMKPGETITTVNADVVDTVRYTVQVPGDNYASDVVHTVNRLRGEGYESVKWRNGWLQNRGYQGINSAWRDPETGRVFEVQFHTPESFDAKMVTHDLYKQVRLPDTDPATAAALNARQALVFDAVPRPAGLDDLTAFKLGLKP